MSELTPSRLRTLFAGYSSLRVGVVGDFSSTPISTATPNSTKPR